LVLVVLTLFLVLVVLTLFLVLVVLTLFLVLVVLTLFLVLVVLVVPREHGRRVVGSRRGRRGRVPVDGGGRDNPGRESDSREDGTSDDHGDDCDRGHRRRQALHGGHPADARIVNRP
ncbi:hypothetical protein, partial [Halosimplex halophilum]|uniref:hypothetical protein n=1 Tax=Halosimplex halophilum TaxID=2559572 RepID=UPI001AEB16C1